MKSNLLTLLVLSGCSYPIGYVKPQEQTVIIVPQRVLDTCDSFSIPATGDKHSVMASMLDNRLEHAQCSFLNDLKGDYLRAATVEKSIIRLMD